MKCERCGGDIVFKKIVQTGKRKPSLRGKRICEKCGFWPAAYNTHGSPNQMLDTEAQKPAPRSANRYMAILKENKVEKCQWVGCKENATIFIPRGDTYVCDEHYLINILRFGCDLKGQPFSTSCASKIFFREVQKKAGHYIVNRR